MQILESHLIIVCEEKPQSLETFEGKDHKNYSFYASVYTDFFYNSRTAWRSSLSYKYTRFKKDNDDAVRYSRGIDNMSWSFIISTNLDYRINIPTTLRVHLGYSDSESKLTFIDVSRYNEISGFNFSLSLIHYIY